MEHSQLRRRQASPSSTVVAIDTLTRFPPRPQRSQCGGRQGKSTQVGIFPETMRYSAAARLTSEGALRVSNMEMCNRKNRKLKAILVGIERAGTIGGTGWGRVFEVVVGFLDEKKSRLSAPRVAQSRQAFRREYR
jgi:hypothetical protein